MVAPEPWVQMPALQLTAEVDGPTGCAGGVGGAGAAVGGALGATRDGVLAGAGNGRGGAICGLGAGAALRGSAWPLRFSCSVNGRRSGATGLAGWLCSTGP